jgi:hypothetical protein
VSHRDTQRQQILALLLEARGAEVPLPQILELKISQFGARILELRRDGHRIINRTANIDGQKYSWYRLESALPAPTTSDPAPVVSQLPSSASPMASAAAGALRCSTTGGSRRNERLHEAP